MSLNSKQITELVRNSEIHFRQLGLPEHDISASNDLLGIFCLSMATNETLVAAMSGRHYLIPEVLRAIANIIEIAERNRK